jgi:anti-sigma factor RsiW
VHLDEDTIVALFRGELAAEELQRVDAHMDACTECRVLVSNLAGRTDTDPMSATVAASVLAAPPPARDEARLAAGTVLAGRFSIEQLVGTGGMGEVYRARDAEDGGRV